jgi:transcriptional regulator with XRE-family HTH domain
LTRSPVVSRRRLGSELRSLREASGKTIEDAATALECSSAKISRLETGKGVPKNRDVRDLLRLYGVDDDELAGRLFALASDGQSQGWWEDYKDLTPEPGTEYVGRYIALEQEANSILGYEGDLIHGLLQTVEYAEALLAALAPDVSAEQRRRMVELRMKRQVILRGRTGLPPLHLRVVIGEPAILRPVGSPKIMQRQLQAIRELLDERPDNVNLQVMPLAAGPHAGLGSPFSIVHFDDANDQDVVYLEGSQGGTFLERQPEVDRYTRLLETLQAQALSRDDSLAAIDKQIAALG